MELEVVPAIDAALARALRTARSVTGRSRDEVAALTGIPSLKLYLLETASAALSTPMATALADVYLLEPPDRERLLAAAAADEQAAVWLEAVPGPFSHWNDLDVLHLVTVGRKTGRRLTKAWPLFAVDGEQVLLLAARERTDWVANVNANPLVGIGPPGAPQQGTARVVSDRTEENRRRQLIVWRRLDRPMELKDGRLIVVDVDPDAPPFEW